MLKCSNLAIFAQFFILRVTNWPFLSFVIFIFQFAAIPFSPLGCVQRVGRLFGKIWLERWLGMF